MQSQNPSETREFITERDVERLTGRKRQTLQRDRQLRRGFPFYRIGRQILYDAREVRDAIRASRVEVNPGGNIAA
jgi:hypothetical protein